MSVRYARIDTGNLRNPVEGLIGSQHGLLTASSCHFPKDMPENPARLRGKWLGTRAPLVCAVRPDRHAAGVARDCLSSMTELGFGAGADAAELPPSGRSLGTLNWTWVGEGSAFFARLR